MASPFNIFRKNVKPLLAVFVVMLMLSWVVGDSLIGFFSGSRNGIRAGSPQDGRATAVSWDGGELTNQEVGELVSRRRILNTFLQQVEANGARSAYEAGVEPRPIRVERMSDAPDTPERGVEQSVVQTRLFADAARAAGMRVSDEAIVQYLDELGRGNVRRDEMRTIVSHFRSEGGQYSIDAILGTLREEMLARNFINSNQYAFLTVTPEQRWIDWLRVNDRVVVEAAALPVDKYLVDVKEPTDAELAAFFDKYKDREASPEIIYGSTELPSASPGFRIPRKIDVQFIEANYDSFLAKAEEKVTDEEVAKYYEEHKDPMFVKADTGLMEDKGEKKDATPPEDGAAKATDAETKPESTEGKAEAEEKPQEKTEEKTDATPPAAEGKKDAAEEKKQSQLDRKGPNGVFHLVAFQDADKNDVPAADAKAGEASTTTAETPAAPPADATPPAPPTAPEAPATTGLPTGLPAVLAPPVAAPAAPKKPLEFQPLEQVKDLIRTQIAAGKVSEELDKLTTDIDNQLEGDFNKYLAAVLTAQAEKQQVPEAPKSLTDLAPTAEKNGLTTSATGPMSVLELRQTPVGKSGVAESNRTLLSLLFGGKELDLWQPVATKDVYGNHYVAMKKSDTPGYVPKLADVKDEVVKAWKLQQAAELAEKHAKEFATKAQESKSPLTTFFADDPAIKVVRTDPFSELTGGDVGFANGQLQQEPYRLSQPDGLVAAGPDLIKRAVGQKDGEVSAVLNNDHTIAYVVRTVEHQPALNELRSAYLAEANTWPGLNVMSRGHMQEIFASVANDIIAGSNLKWERKNDVTDQAEQKEEESEGG